MNNGHMRYATSPNVKTFIPTYTPCSYISRALHAVPSITKPSSDTHIQYSILTAPLSSVQSSTIPISTNHGYLQEVPFEAMEERANKGERRAPERLLRVPRRSAANLGQMGC